MTSEVTQADSGMDGQSVELAELVWANLPTNRSWASLPTYEKALVCHTLARLTAQSGEGRSGAGEDGPTTAIIAGLWLDILEKDDRTSLEEYPDMALITEEEFAGSIRYALAALNARQPGEGEREIAFPTEPGYYWAKLKTPHGMPEGEDWASRDWEIVKVWENTLGGYDPHDEDSLAVDVFGVSVTQWPLDFFWGPKVDAMAPA